MKQLHLATLVAALCTFVTASRPARAEHVEQAPVAESSVADPTDARAADPCVSADPDVTCIARELARTLTASPHSLSFTHLIEFEPGRVRVYSAGRQKVKELAATWRERGWGAITVDGYAAPSGLMNSSAAQQLAQRRAERIRDYLVRYGVPRDVITAVGHAPEGSTAADKFVDVRVDRLAATTTP